MSINVQVKPRCKVEGIETVDDTHFIVKVHTPPVDGAANIRVVEILSKHLKIAKSNIRLVRGHKSKTKVFEIT